ncbi:MAG: hypothetical protein J5679_02695 [Alphaproteobacteria bacterium]|nr:hypothetical protein [Alphaproteobacteria bacterium]
MKKQTKAKKLQSAQPTTVRVVHNGWQRFWGIVALTGLFLCGLFVGMAINSPKNPYLERNRQNVVDQVPAQEDVCVEVERLLLRRLPMANDDVDDRIGRAKIYVSLAERGCIENSDKYAELARQELEVARAIEDDNFDHAETIDVVETYKRLNMQAAAEEIFEKAKKLTDPAIDFIIQVEKIINE